MFITPPRRGEIHPGASAAAFASEIDRNLPADNTGRFSRQNTGVYAQKRRRHRRSHLLAVVELPSVRQQLQQRLPADDADHVEGLRVRLAGPRRYGERLRGDSEGVSSGIHKRCYVMYTPISIMPKVSACALLGPGGAVRRDSARTSDDIILEFKSISENLFNSKNQTPVMMKASGWPLLSAIWGMNA